MLNFVDFMTLNPFSDIDRYTGPNRNNVPVSKIFELRVRTHIQSLCIKLDSIISKATVYFLLTITPSGCNKQMHKLNIPSVNGIKIDPGPGLPEF